MKKKYAWASYCFQAELCTLNSANAMKNKPQYLSGRPEKLTWWEWKALQLHLPGGAMTVKVAELLTKPETPRKTPKKTPAVYSSVDSKCFKEPSGHFYESIFKILYYFTLFYTMYFIKTFKFQFRARKDIKPSVFHKHICFSCHSVVPSIIQVLYEWP